MGWGIHPSTFDRLDFIASSQCTDNNMAGFSLCCMSLFVCLLGLVLRRHIIPCLSLSGAGMTGMCQHTKHSITLGICGGSEILVILKPG